MILHNALRKSRALINGIGRMVGFNEAEGGVERLGETLTPIVHPWGLPEWAYLRGERLGALTINSPAVAAELSGVALVNPLDSGMLVVVEAISAKTGAASVALIKLATSVVVDATYANTTANYTRDRRWRDSNNYLTRALSKFGSNIGIVAGTPLEELALVSTSMNPALTCLPLILAPGDVVLVENGLANTAIVANIGWRERVAFRGELS